MGVGEGRTGDAYALPTCEVSGCRRTLQDIASSVARFCAYADHHPELTFYVTRIGCGSWAPALPAIIFRPGGNAVMRPRLRAR